MEYLPTIGLEIHAELKTQSKMFCACANNPDEERPNINICPICLAHPGILPVLNKEAIKHVLKVGLAVNGTLADFTEWDRKNYFYPDIPKGYQLSQYKFPLVSGGMLSGVEIERIHLEEDTAQSTHDTHEKSLINFNRSGVPLMELVTEPVIHDAGAAVRFAKELRLLLRYLGASEANLEKGEMRIEANVSVVLAAPTNSLSREGSPDFAEAKRRQTKGEAPSGEKEFVGAVFNTDMLGTKTEVKNLNSFKSVEKAIEYEIERQIEILERGEKVIQETRGWDDAKNETYSQRSKESSHDYRYFPDPDIPKLKISEVPEFSRASLSKDMPELPEAKRARFARDFGMNEKEISVFIESPWLADYYESIVAKYPNDSRRIKLTTNYFLSDYLGIIKDAISITSAVPRSCEGSPDFAGAKRRQTKGETPSGDQGAGLFAGKTTSGDRGAVSFAELITMIANGEISSRGAKGLLTLMIKNPESSPRALAEKHNLLQKSDAAEIEPAIDKVIADNSSVAAEYKAGKVASLQFLIGQAMKITKGAANPAIVKELLMKKLDK